MIKLDGKALSALMREELTVKVADLAKIGIRPKLVVILVGEDPASQIYVRNKHRQAELIGIESVICKLDATITEKELVDQVRIFNTDPSVNGILVQLPLPKQIDQETILTTIDPAKDVDGFHPYNIGKLWSGHQQILPSTPAGIMKILAHYEIPIAGKKALVIGRSVIVGRPMAGLLLNANATVTIAHSKTQNLSELTKEADILVSAVGLAEFITGKDIKPGAAVIDVGMNRNAAGKLVGDIEQESAGQVAGYLTPVPGGVGPMTIAMLMDQTVSLAQQQNKK